MSAAFKVWAVRDAKTGSWLRARSYRYQRSCEAEPYIYRSKGAATSAKNRLSRKWPEAEVVVFDVVEAK